MTNTETVRSIGQLAATWTTAAAAHNQVRHEMTQASLRRDVATVDHRLALNGNALNRVKLELYQSEMQVTGCKGNIDFLRQRQQLLKLIPPGDRTRIARDEALIGVNQQKLASAQASVKTLTASRDQLQQEGASLSTRRGELNNQLAHPVPSVVAAGVAGLGTLLHGYQAYQAFAEHRTAAGVANVAAAAGNGMVAYAALAPQALKVGRIGLGLAIGGSLAAIASQALASRS